jgi:hypothetical protein
MFSQALPVTDTPGWGLAEWATVVILSLAVLTGVVGAIVQLVRLRSENTSQHAEGRALVTDVRDRLLDLHGAVDRVDLKVDRIDERLDGHLDWHRDKPSASDTYRTEL